MTRFAYLVSQYPAFNHTFILREIRALRQKGFLIDVISIRSCDRPVDRLTAEERDESEHTWYVKPLGIAGILSWNLRALLSAPLGYLRGLLAAIRLAGADGPRLVRYLFYFAEAAVAGKRLQQQGISHFHVHFSSTVGLLMTKIFPLTMSLTVHGPDEFNDAVGFHIAEKVAASRLVTAISHFARSQLMRFSSPAHWDRIAVSRLGVDSSIFEPRPHRPAPDRFEMCCVGRLAPAKAQIVLVRACARLAAAGRRFRLRIVGEGPDRAAILSEITRLRLQDSILLTGALNQDEVRALYRECDIFALGSFAEGVPVVLMEAMAMEIPCVSTYIAGIPELIRDGVEGLLTPASDDEQLAAAIARLMDDPELRLRLGRQARLRVLADYDLGRNAARLGDLLRASSSS